MANFLKPRGSEWMEDVGLAKEIAVALLQALLLVCVLWYAGKVLYRSTQPPIEPAQDIHWSVAERGAHGWTV